MIHSVLRIQEPFEKITEEFVEQEFTVLREVYNALEPVKSINN